jgi:single-strand DNA-binding protein
MNHFIGIGRLAGAGVLSYTPGGTAYVKFCICISKARKDKGGERVETPNFFNCVLWGKYGETLAKYLTKGKQVAVEAELEQDAWTDAEGNRHSAVRLHVNELRLLSSPKGAEPPEAGDVPF